MRTRITRFVPGYAAILLLILLAVNWITYNGTRLYTTNLYHHVLESGFDRQTPFVPAFIVVYWGAYIQWVLGLLFIARDRKDICYKFLIGEIFAKLICFIIYMVFPTTNIRPVITGNGIFSRGVQLLYSIDAADNLFPSIHCLESYICLRASFSLVKIKNRSLYVMIMYIATVGVFASTMFLKQHVIADMFGAIAAAELGIAVSTIILKKRKCLNG